MMILKYCGGHNLDLFFDLMTYDYVQLLYSYEYHIINVTMHLLGYAF